MSKELQWSYDTGKIDRKFTKEWSVSGFINLEKVPDLVKVLVTERKSMIEYIEALHNKLDDIIEKNNICHAPGCHTTGCTSDHK